MARETCILSFLFPEVKYSDTYTVVRAKRNSPNNQQKSIIAVNVDMHVLDKGKRPLPCVWYLSAILSRNSHSKIVCFHTVCTLWYSYMISEVRTVNILNILLETWSFTKILAKNIFI